MWIDNLETRFAFFTGKGGVGKTSLSAATALQFAKRGLRTIIISTDPASNLDEVFETKLGMEPTPISGIPGLFGVNLDPEAAAQAYREKIVGPYRGVLPDAVLRNMEEQFSGACTTEIASFDEFVRLITDPATVEKFDRVIFDTAPTGHTLRLLSLPSAWNGYLNTTTSETSCLGPLAGLQDQREKCKSALERLADPGQTTIVLVARPEGSSLNEAARTRNELAELGIRNLRLVVNGVFVATDTQDPVAMAFAEGCREGLASMPDGLKLLPVSHVPMMGFNIVGRQALEALVLPMQATVGDGDHLIEVPHGLDFGTFVDEISQSGSGVIMTMGKGGVGKTTIAVEIALELGRRNFPVLLTTTDPAGNLDDWKSQFSSNVTVRSIDPEAEIRKYSENIIEAARPEMDEEGLALLVEDLRSPCTEEIAVFRAFAEAVFEGKQRFVVVDTAPTGHSLLLLDSAEAYHREVLRTTSEMPESVRQLLPTLRDAVQTKIVIVTLPQPTPVHEAERLQDDLRRAGIEPFGWIVNQSLSLAGPTDPLLRAKANQESGPFAEAARLSNRLVGMAWTPKVHRSQPCE